MQFARDRRRRIEALVQELRDYLEQADERGIDIAQTDLQDELYDLNREAYLYEADDDEGDLLGRIGDTLKKNLSPLTTTSTPALTTTTSRTPPGITGTMIGTTTTGGGATLWRTRPIAMGGYGQQPSLRIIPVGLSGQSLQRSTLRRLWLRQSGLR